MPPPALSLKQRLAALSSAPSSPAAPASPTASRPSWRKGAFSVPIPWAKRPAHEVVPTDCDADRVQEIMARVIFQAGVDFETRPMVVMNASALPDPCDVSYDILLTQILSYLDLFVESDYTVVFFAAGGRHSPGWNWVWKAYRSLSRKYRKNLKRLYIVHSTFFSKMLFSLAGAIISPKFFRKLTYINTLSELACQVPLTQIDIPPAVYQENLKYENQITLPTPTRSSMFGVHLEELMGYDGEKGGLPRVVKDCIQYLRETGLNEEGLFRRSPNSVLLRQAREAYDRGHTVSLHTFADPHLAAVLLKKFIRDLPEPIFPEHTYNIIRRCPPPTDDPSDISTVSYIRETLLPELPPCAYILLSNILHLMNEVSLHATTNRMDAHNLAIVLCPNLVAGGNPLRDVMICAISSGPSPLSPILRTTSSASTEGKTTLGMVIKTCIQRYFEIFDEVRDRSEAVPPAVTGTPSSVSSASGSPIPTLRHLDARDDEESIDDAMLVMPVGPGRTHTEGHGARAPAGPPSAWGATAAAFPYKTRERAAAPGAVRSMHAGGGRGNGAVGVGSISKAKSLISVEKGAGEMGARRGTATIGRGTARKASGAGVTAISVTAAGFFTAPSNAAGVARLGNGRAEDGKSSSGPG